MFKKYGNLKKVLLVALIIFATSFIVSCYSSLDVYDDDSVVVFKNVNVIPMNTETVLNNYNIMIEDEKIVKLDKAWKTRVPKNATVINGKINILHQTYLTCMYIYGIGMNLNYTSPKELLL